MVGKVHPVFVAVIHIERLKMKYTVHQRNANEPEAIVLYRVEIMCFPTAGDTCLTFQSGVVSLNALLLDICGLL